jgi:hypothetical protein
MESVPQFLGGCGPPTVGTGRLEIPRAESCNWGKEARILIP